MSWDVILLNVPSRYAAVEDIPDDFNTDLGPAAMVLARLKAALPELDLTDPTWGILDGHDWSIEFNIGSKDPITSIMLHVRGGDDAVGAIHHVCDVMSWRALDTGDGEFMDFSADPGKGFRVWREYRNRVVAETHASGRAMANNPKSPGIRVDAVVHASSTKSRTPKRNSKTRPA